MQAGQRLQGQINADAKASTTSALPHMLENTAVPVLGYPDTSSSHNEGRGCRDVKGSCGVSTGAACINQHLTNPYRTMPVQHLILAYRRSFGANDLGKPINLFNGFALHGQGGQKCRNLRVVACRS